MGRGGGGGEGREGVQNLSNPLHSCLPELSICTLFISILYSSYPVCFIWRVPGQNGLSRLYSMVEIYHSSVELIYSLLLVPADWICGPHKSSSCWALFLLRLLIPPGFWIRALSLSLSVCLFVCLSVCLSVSVSLSFCACVCARAREREREREREAYL